MARKRGPSDILHVDLPNLFRQSAVYADRVLKGADPANRERMSQRFGNPARARDPHALPDLETFNVEPGDNKPLKPGWYWRPCLLGGHGEPAGPFETEAEALADATHEDVITEAAGQRGERLSCRHDPEGAGIYSVTKARRGLGLQ